ncbi:ninjurin-A-like [Prorops nasuta]|uniref:ninjurin-A-like n=1 Tax=Prorops nasuta TaxID=863751 RepID=UPI0034CEF16B
MQKEFLESKVKTNNMDKVNKEDKEEKQPFDPEGERINEIFYMDELSNDLKKPLKVEIPDSITATPMPLSELSNHANSPLLARPETDEMDGSNEHVDKEHDDNKGIDDGLMTERSMNMISPTGSTFSFEPRADFPASTMNDHQTFPISPPDTIFANGLPDVNVYQHKKTLAQGMMDLALLSANANQFRYVLQSNGRHPYYYPSLAMIGASLFLQIAVGIGLIWNSTYNVKVDDQMYKADRANNWTVIGIFLVTILNVFISSFGVVDQLTPTV